MELEIMRIEEKDDAFTRINKRRKMNTKLFSFQEKKGEVYFIFAKDKKDALSVIDASYKPPARYTIDLVKEIDLSMLNGAAFLSRFSKDNFKEAPIIFDNIEQLEFADMYKDVE